MDILDNFIDFFDDFMPLIVAITGAIICLVILVLVCYPEKDDSYYAKVDNLIHSCYTVYINGSVVDKDKIIISDYPADKIHINDELKEIYIGSSGSN